MSTKLRVLLVEDSEDDALLVIRELRRGGYELDCERVVDREGFRAALQKEPWDIIISDHMLPTYDGIAALSDARETGKDIPFILVSGSIGESMAVSIMKSGAQDYVLKGDLTRLPAAVEREVREARLRAQQQRMREQLVISERMASAGMLAAGVAHEINNPLAVAYGCIEFLGTALGKLAAESRSHAQSEVPLDTRIRELDEPLRDARDALRRIRDIVRDVKLFSRPVEEPAGPANVERVIESSVRMAYNEIRHRATLVRDYGDVPPVDANEARLGQVVLNLLVNAAQAMPEGRASHNQIRVATRRHGRDHVVIEVADTGKGIPAEDLERIFDPFFTTKPVGVGTGLGLSICHRIVTNMGGSISVDSKAGVGTTFRLTLNAAKAEPTKEAKAAVTVPPANRARVLVVDDEIAIARGMQRLLHGEHDVVALGSADEALTRFRNGERFDIIFSDLMMPETSGMDLYDQLVKIAPDQAAKMVFLTGGAFTPQAREFLNRVSQPILEKPFDIQSVETLIRARKT